MQPGRNLFKNENEFSLFIEQTAATEKINCYQALINYCDQEGIEYESTVKILSKSLREKIRQEFVELGMLRSYATLE